VPKGRIASWRERISFTDSAVRDFDGLPPEVQRAFLSAFPIFSQHPWRASPDLDVAPLRDMPERWRLKVEGGDRAVHRMVHGIPELEMFETRTAVYERLRRYLDSKG
jgi:hypothetical protein